MVPVRAGRAVLCTAIVRNEIVSSIAKVSKAGAHPVERGHAHEAERDALLRGGLGRLAPLLAGRHAAAEGLVGGGGWGVEGAEGG